MSDVRPQLSPEKPQQELRFTARDPVLDEALALLEKDGEAKSSYFPKNLFLYAMKRISIDTSDMFDGQSQNHSTFSQYRQSLDFISSRGKKQFKLAPWMKPLYLNGSKERVRGVGLRLLIDPLYVNKVLAPPLYGSSHHLPPITADQREIDSSADDVLRVARAGKFLPIRYEIGDTVDDPTEALERLGEVLELGVYVSQLIIVPSYPRSAREADIFREDKIERTYKRIDEYIEHELAPPTEPIDITPDSDPTMRSAG